MADGLTATELALTAGPVPRARWRKQLFLTNDSTAEVEITDRVLSFGRCKTAVSNRDPKTKGRITLPDLSMRVHNDDGKMDPGNAAGYFPAGDSDLNSTVIRFVLTLLDTGAVKREFKARVLQPDVTDDRVIELFGEHGLVTAKTRFWRREDQIGGDTGATVYLVGIP